MKSKNHFQWFVISLILFLSLNSCSEKDIDEIEQSQITTTTIPVPKGFTLLTEESYKKSLLDEGLSVEQINLVLKEVKLQIKPEELNQTETELNKNAKSTILSRTAGNLFNAAQIDNNFVNDEAYFDPVPNNDDQRFRFNGNQWYPNKPGACTWGYFNNRSNIRYKKWANNLLDGTSNVEIYSQANFCWRDNNTSWSHLVILYYWNGSSWQAIWSKTKTGNASSINQLSSEIAPELRLGTELFLIKVAINSNANLSGAPNISRQQIQFNLYW